MNRMSYISSKNKSSVLSGLYHLKFSELDGSKTA